MNRLLPSYFKSCDRTHEAENPRVTFHANGAVRFHCNRGGKSILIGSFKETAKESIRRVVDENEIKVPSPTSVTELAESTQVQKLDKCQESEHPPAAAGGKEKRDIYKAIIEKKREKILARNSKNVGSSLLELVDEDDEE